MAASASTEGKDASGTTKPKDKRAARRCDRSHQALSCDRLALRFVGVPSGTQLARAEVTKYPLAHQGTGLKDATNGHTSCPTRAQAASVGRGRRGPGAHLCDAETDECALFVREWESGGSAVGPAVVQQVGVKRETS